MLLPEQLGHHNNFVVGDETAAHGACGPVTLAVCLLSHLIGREERKVLLKPAGPLLLSGRALPPVLLESGDQRGMWGACGGRLEDGRPVGPSGSLDEFASHSERHKKPA